MLVSVMSTIPVSSVRYEVLSLRLKLMLSQSHNCCLVRPRALSMSIRVVPRPLADWYYSLNSGVLTRGLRVKGSCFLQIPGPCTVSGQISAMGELAFRS